MCFIRPPSPPMPFTMEKKVYKIVMQLLHCTFQNHFSSWCSCFLRFLINVTYKITAHFFFFKQGFKQLIFNNGDEGKKNNMIKNKQILETLCHGCYTVITPCSILMKQLLKKLSYWKFNIFFLWQGNKVFSKEDENISKN